MQETGAAAPITRFVDQFTTSLPVITAGVLVLLLGVAVGWIAKRAVIRVLVWLRLDRLAGRVGWRAAFAKGDARAALYTLAGNLVFLVIVLVFLDDALARWQFTALARMVDTMVFYIPSLVLAGVIVGVGMVISAGLAERVTHALEEDGFVPGRIVGRIVRASLLAVVIALALWQLNFAREIVLSGFLIAFGSLGIAFALATGIGSAKAVQRAWERLFDKHEPEEPVKPDRPLP